MVSTSGMRSTFFCIPYDGMAWSTSQDLQVRPQSLHLYPSGVQLSSGLVFCEVKSWITGARLVSLAIFRSLRAAGERCGGTSNDSLPNYESRRREIYDMSRSGLALSRSEPQTDVWPYAQHCLSVIDLRPGVEELYSRLHKDSVQRKLRRAEREHVVLDQGRSEKFLLEFYELMVLTRRRHQIPPQPLAWFQNLYAEFWKEINDSRGPCGQQANREHSDAATQEDHRL